MKKLSEKAMRFCQEYVKNGYSARKAYMDAYGQDDAVKASAGAYMLLKDPRVKEEINGVEGDFRNTGYVLGINKEVMVKVLKDMMEATKTMKKEVIGEDGKTKFETIEVPDHKTRFDGVMGFAKLTGDISEKKVQEIDDDSLPADPGESCSEMKVDDLKKKREEILTKMFENAEKK